MPARQLGPIVERYRHCVRINCLQTLELISNRCVAPKKHARRDVRHRLLQVGSGIRGCALSHALCCGSLRMACSGVYSVRSSTCDVTLATCSKNTRQASLSYATGVGAERLRPASNGRCAHLRLVSFKNFPSCNSVNACRSCSCVFITMGPYHATGSSSGFPETSRNRIPSSPARTVTPGNAARSF